MSISMPRPGRSGTVELAVNDLQRVFGEALAVLPDPMGVDRGDFAGRCRGYVGKHCERDVKVIVGVRAPGEAPLAAELGHADRALHRPEVRIGQGYVDGVELNRMLELAPVGGDHVRRGGKAGGAAKLRHDLAAGEALLGAAWVFRVREDIVLAGAEPDGFVERPCSVWVKRDAGVGEALSEGGDCLPSPVRRRALRP